MEMSLWPYVPGAIVEYKAPFNKDVCVRYGILPSHMVLIVNEVFPTPAKAYQCMMLTSKTNSYYGYRVYINGTKKHGYSNVRCTQIFTIDACQLGNIVGFVPKQFVEKCRKAYAFEIGLTDEIPEYYRQDPVVMGWLTAGEPNIPKHPDAFQVEDQKMNPEARFDLQVATSRKPKSTSLTKVPYVFTNTQGLTTEDIPPYEAPPINGVQCDADADETTDAIDNEPKLEPVETPCRNGVEHTLNEEDIAKIKAAKSGDKKKKTYHRPMSADLKYEIETRNPEYIKVDDNIKKAFDKLGHDRQYEAYLGRLSPTDIVKSGIIKSQYSAKKLLDYTIWKVYKQKEKLIDGILNKSINLKFLGTAFYAAYRCMSLKDIHDIKMGVQTYESYLESFGFTTEQSYIGELRKAELLANPIPK